MHDIEEQVAAEAQEVSAAAESAATTVTATAVSPRKQLLRNARRAQ